MKEVNSELWTPNEPASSVAISGAENALRTSFPASYRTFLLSTDGGYGDIPVQPGCVEFIRCSDLGSANRDYQVADYLPGYLLIATSGTGEGFVVKVAEPEWPVFYVPLIGMAPHECRLLCPSFTDFVQLVGSGKWDCDA